MSFTESHRSKQSDGMSEGVVGRTTGEPAKRSQISFPIEELKSVPIFGAPPELSPTFALTDIIFTVCGRLWSFGTHLSEYPTSLSRRYAICSL